MSNECAVEVKNVVESMPGSAKFTQPQPISDDWEYIGRQFKICDLLVRKYEMLRESKEPRNNPGPNTKKKRKISKSAFSRINMRLKLLK